MRPFLQTLVLGVVSVSLCSAQDLDEVLSNLQQKYETVRDLHASFAQTVVFGVTRATQTFEGEIWIRKGNRYRIELEQRTIVTDGVSVWTYSPMNRQVFIDVFRESPNSITPDRVLIDVPKNYAATMLASEELHRVRRVVLKLVPKEKKSLVKSMKVWVDPSEWLMVKVEVLDVSDNVTTYSTEDIEINSGFSDGLFQFDIPAGVEVVDLRPSSVKTKPDSP